MTSVVGFYILGRAGKRDGRPTFLELFIYMCESSRERAFSLEKFFVRGMIKFSFRYFPRSGYSLQPRAGEESPDTIG